MKSNGHSPSSSRPSLSSPTSPGLAASTSALILVPDDPEEPTSPFSFSDNDDDDELSQHISATSSTIPPLSPSIIFLYLLSPCLKLGALAFPNGSHIPLKFSIPALALFAGLSAFSRQIWYMLARYVRKADTEEVIMDAFARGRGKDGRRRAIRAIVRFCTTALRLLLLTIYMRESVDVVLPLLPQTLNLPLRPIVSSLVTLAVLPLCLAQSLAAKRVLYATSASVGTFLLWLICSGYAFARGSRGAKAGWSGSGSLWQPITSIAFAFASSSTLGLYASLSASAHQLPTKPKQSHSFTIISTVSTTVSALLIIPLLFFSVTSDHVETSELSIHPFIACLNALTLILAIPSLVITTPSISVPSFFRRRATNIPISKIVLLLSLLGLSQTPERASAIMSNILLVAALLATYVLPALIHITTHYFKRPLSIVIPQSPFHHTHSEPAGPQDDDTHALLQRKESTLQRRRLWRRLLWDVGVWVLLVPIGGGGITWTVGRLVGKW